MTLRILRITDQNLTSIDNINYQLPNLIELYLYRNYIKSINISTFNYLPHLKILWLTQNQLVDLPIHLTTYLPDLQILNLQSNFLTNLNFLLTNGSSNSSLKTIGLAGNPISSLNEFDKLKSYNCLTDLSLQDIHFGKCPVCYESEGYREYLLTHLKQLDTLDGVKINKQRIQLIGDKINNEINKFNDSLREIEIEYRREINHIENDVKNREKHSQLLEKEMTDAFKDLQQLINDGTEMLNDKLSYYSNQLVNHKEIFQKNLNNLTIQSTNSLSNCLNNYISTYDFTLASSLTLDRLLDSELQLVDMLNSKINSKIDRRVISFQPISSTSPDYLYFSSSINISNYLSTNQSSNHNKKLDKPVDNKRNSKIDNKIDKQVDGNVVSMFEVYRLYKIIYESNDPLNQSTNELVSNIDIYTIMDLTTLSSILSNDLSTSTPSNLLLTNDLNLLLSLLPNDTTSCSTSLSNYATNCFDYNKLDNKIDNYADDFESSHDSSLDNKLDCRTTNNLNKAYSSNYTTIQKLLSDRELDDKMNSQINLSSLIDPNHLSLYNKSLQRKFLLIASLSVDRSIISSTNSMNLTNPSTNNENMKLLDRYMNLSTPMTLHLQDSFISIYPINSQSISRLTINYLSIVITNPIDGGIDSLLIGLERLSVPLDKNDISPLNILNNFNESVKNETDKYIYKLFEELTEEEANTYENVEKQISNKETHLRNVREEIERERLLQDQLLRDYRSSSLSIPSTNDQSIHTNNNYPPSGAKRSGSLPSTKR